MNLGKHIFLSIVFLLEAFPDFWIKYIRVRKQIRGSEFKSKALKEGHVHYKFSELRRKYNIRHAAMEKNLQIMT